MKQSFLFCMTAGALLFMLSSCSPVSCSNTTQEKTERLTVMNWNLETFFDANFDGNEYSEFKNGNAGWTREKYDTRLDRLASVIKTLDADVLVFEELEKEAQLYDISNRLSGTFNFSKLYAYAFFATDQGSSIGCAVLSRLPIGEVRTHSLDVRTAGIDQPSMRPILQFSVFAGSDGEKKLVVFANHWKSKSGDSNGETALWRRHQENMLATVMADALSNGNAVLACGDFNMDILEFSTYEGDSARAGTASDAQGTYVANVALGEKNLPVYSPWYDAQFNLQEPGSYWYNNAWERIDNFFAAGKVIVSSFAARTDGSWATSAGKPIRYQVYNGAGYSDHLPLTCTVTF